MTVSQEVHRALRNIMHLLEGGHDDVAQAEVQQLLEAGYEAAARAHGWRFEREPPDLTAAIVHPSRPGRYELWRDCCEAEAIDVGGLTGELPDALERAAADLWRKENPDMSVFACIAAMKGEYRRRVLKGGAP